MIGELSNNGQPMHKFVQSFVLAPQSAKKYYVHIDIFRYQDAYPSTSESDAPPLDHSVEGSGCRLLIVSWVNSSVNPFTTDPVKALQFAILV